MIKTLLAITNDPGADTSHTASWPRYATSATSTWLGWPARDQAQLVLGGELIGRIAAQTCRQPGLSIVYMELLDFDGDEIYFFQRAGAGRPDIRRRAKGYRTSSLIGIVPGRRKATPQPAAWTASSPTETGSSSSPRTTTPSGARTRPNRRHARS